MKKSIAVLSKYFVQQVVLLPFVWFGTVIFASLFAYDYSHISQHASELALNSNKTAVLIFTIGAITMGIMMVLFSIGLIINFGKQLLITSILISLFGITLLFGAVFPTGSPLHSLYDIGISIIIVPFIFLYEINRFFNSRILNRVTLFCGFLSFLYVWSMIIGIDPQFYRGITQRLYVIVLFGWISYIGYILNKYSLAEGNKERVYNY